MVGNGLQGVLLGLRAEIEGFSTLQISVVMSAYFAGFLGGARFAPIMIQRVGHVRVFAALASFISAALILFPVFTTPFAWIILRVALGFCFSGVYVTAESWLNNAADNDNRGKALSIYMFVQMVGMVIAQLILSQGDPSGWVLFIIPSVLVSISFAPILLSVTPTPPFETSKAMSLPQLYKSSPLGCIGMFIIGGVFSAQTGMSAVYAAQIDLGIGQISTFVGMLYVGAVVTQMPIGWVSDRFDRRHVISAVAFLGMFGALIGYTFDNSFVILLFSALFTGGMVNPLYSLLIAHTNDFLEADEMASSSGGLLFLNGLGAITGPIVVGWFMTHYGPESFWGLQILLMLLLGLYAFYRTTQRAAVPVSETASYVSVMPSATAVVTEVAQEVAIELAENESEDEIEIGTIT